MFTYFKRSVHSIAEYKEMENRMIQRIVEQCFAKENCFFFDSAKVENILSLLKEEGTPGPKFWT